VFWFWLGLLILLSMPVTITLYLVYLYIHLCRTYLHHVVQIFQVKPLFVVPTGQPVPEAEDLRFPTENGLTLRGCYLRGTVPPGGSRAGVILFGLEFGSNRWACVSSCEPLLQAGFDVFAYEPRCQGESDRQPGYEPLQWVTRYEVADARAALAYLKGRPDGDPRGVGFFGLSKGAGAALHAAMVPHLQQPPRPPGAAAVVVLRFGRPGRSAPGGAGTAVPFRASGNRPAAPGAAAAVDDPWRQRQLHQARDGEASV
jgi:dienelactone hydrolase